MSFNPHLYLTIANGKGKSVFYQLVSPLAPFWLQNRFPTIKWNFLSNNCATYQLLTCHFTWFFDWLTSILMDQMSTPSFFTFNFDVICFNDRNSTKNHTHAIMEGQIQLFSAIKKLIWPLTNSICRYKLDWKISKLGSAVGDISEYSTAYN